MRKISILLLCLLIIGSIRTFAQSNCNAAYTWTPYQNATNTLGVLFTNSSTGGTATSYTQTNIYYGDGYWGYIGSSGTYNYSSPGTYNSMLVVKSIDSLSGNVICSDTAYQQVIINYSPCAVSVAMPQSVGGGSYSFAATNLANTPGITYSWNFGDNTTGTGATTTHTYTTGGYYMVTVTATVSGCTSTATTYVIYDPCAITASVVNNGGGSFTFTGTSVNNNPNITYNWHFDNGPAVTGNPVTHTYTAGGYYYPTVIATGAACSGYDSIVVPVTYIDSTVNCSALSASFTVNNNGLSSYFNNTSTNPYSFSYLNIEQSADWYFGDGSSTLNAYSTSHTYATPGTYFVLMVNHWVDSISGQVYCFDTAISQVTVNLPNYISGAISWDSLTNNPGAGDSMRIWLIQHDTVSNSLNAVDSITINYIPSWSFYQNYQFNNVASGFYLVKAAILNQTPGTAGLVPTYHLSSIYWGGATNIVHNGGATSGKDILMQSGTATSGPGFVGGNISSGAGKGTGTGVAGLIVYLRGANNTLIASAVTDINGDYSFSGIPAGTYNVYPELMSYATTPYNAISVTTAQPHVEAIDFEKVDNTIVPKNKPTSIAAISKQDGLNVYPNPVKNQLVIESKNGLFNKVVIVNTLGQTIQENKLVNGVNKIQLSGINAGIYYLRISGADQSRSMKIVKE